MQDVFQLRYKHWKALRGWEITSQFKETQNKSSDQKIQIENTFMKLLFHRSRLLMGHMRLFQPCQGIVCLRPKVSFCLVSIYFMLQK